MRHYPKSPPAADSPEYEEWKRIRDNPDAKKVVQLW